MRLRWNPSSRVIRLLDSPHPAWFGSALVFVILAACVPGTATAVDLFNGAYLDFSSTSWAKGVAIRDLDGDGRLDLLTVSNDSVSVRLGVEGGGFGARTDHASRIGTTGFVLEDVSGDGHPDLVVSTTMGGGSCSVMLGDGAGGFAAGTDFTVSGLGVSVTLADFGNDGRLDIAVGCFNNTVSILFGDGSGGFGGRVDVPTGVNNSYIAAADLNCDGTTDLVMANYSTNNVSVMLGTGGGVFGPRTDFAVGTTPYGVAIADLNGDEFPDLVVPNNGSYTVSVLLGTGSGSFGAKTDYYTDSYPTSIAIADFNRDGAADVIVTAYPSNSVSVFPGTGTGALGTPAEYPVPARPIAVIAADMNDDGWPDLAVTRLVTTGSGTTTLLVPSGSGSLTPAVLYPCGSTPTDIATGDLDGDGQADVVACSAATDSVQVWLGDGLGGLGAPTRCEVGDFPSGVALGDFNEDLLPDLAVSNGSSHSVSVLLGTGSGSFGARTDFPTATYPNDVAVGDFNADSHLDLAVPGQATNRVSVLLGTGTGSFGTKTDFMTGSAPKDVATADLNGDGRLDLVVSNSSANSVSILLGDGAGGFGSKTDYAAGFGPGQISIGDLNGDGTLDLAVSDGSLTSPGFYRLYGKGDGTFASGFASPAGSPTGGIAIADMNADGVPDICASHYDGDAVTICIGPRYAHPTGASPGRLAITDLNHDGRPDVVNCNMAGSSISVLLSRMAAQFTPRSVPNPSQPGGPLALLADILVPPPASGLPTGGVSFYEGACRIAKLTIEPGTIATFDWPGSCLGAHLIHAVYEGDSTFRGTITPAFAHRVVPDAHLAGVITSVTDEPGDQGGQVRLAFAPSPLEQKPFSVGDYYHVFRRSPPPPGETSGWELVAMLEAPLEGPTQVILLTTVDSLASSNPLTQFRVYMPTEKWGAYWSDSMGGYSVDNLAPGAPPSFTGTYASGTATLHWGLSEAADFATFRLYRGPSADFVPDSVNLVVSQADTGYVDAAGQPAWYKLTAVDIHGNEGPAATALPNGTAGVVDVGPLSFALEGLRPNPASGGRLTVAFTLPVAAPGTLELLDVSGRRIGLHDVGSLGAGRHTVRLDERGRPAPGFYLLRLRQGANVRVMRAVVLD